MASAVALSSAAGAACSSTDASDAAAAAGNRERPQATQPEYKITVAGDSISVGFGAELRSAVSAPTVVKVIGEDGTGLARPDSFDWPARLRQLAAEFPPQVLVFSTGSNDAQDLRDATGKVVVPFTDAAAWDAEYTRRLGEVLDAFRDTSTTIYWLGQVRTTDDRVGLTNRRIHRLAEAAIASRGGKAAFVADLAALLGTAEEPATRCLLDDGVHLTTACLREAGDGLATRIQPN